MHRLLISVLLLAACGGTTDRATVEYSVTDSAGVELIRNGAVGAHGDSLLMLQESLRLGTVDGPEPLRFYRIGPIVVDDTGTLYVANNGSGEVRVFSESGRFVRSIGRQGEGPGEFRHISLMFLDGETLVMLDGPTLRITRMSTDGDVVDTWRASADSQVVYPVGRTSDGWLLQVDRYGGWPYQIGVAHRDTARILYSPSLEDARPSSARSEEDDARSAAETIVRYPKKRQFGIDAPGTMTANSPLWEAEPAHAIDGRGRVYVSRGVDYRIDVYAATDGLTRRVERAHEPRRVNADMIDRYFDQARLFYDTASERHGEWEISRAAVEGRASLPRVRTLPATGRLLVSRGGAIWVERPDLVEDPVLLEWTREEQPPSYWDVFEASGRFLGTVRLPHTFDPRAVTDREVIGVLRDELDVEHVVRFRIAAER